MNKVIIAIAVLSGLKGFFDAMHSIRNPEKSGGQRRAEREDCKRKGVGPYDAIY